MDDIFAFDNDSEIEEYSEEETEDNPQSMQLILSALDQRDYDYYNRFGKTEDERAKKWGVEAYPAMRWLSSVGISEVDWAEAKKQGRKKGDKKGAWPSTTVDNEYTAYFLMAVNEIANIKFWDLGNHRKLQFLLLACIGQGQLPGKTAHTWIKMPKKSKAKNKFQEVFLQLYPNANSLELKILSEKYSDSKKFTALCKTLGYSDQQIKEILKK